MTPLQQVGVNIALLAAGWCARWSWDLGTRIREVRSRDQVEQEAARILPGLRERVVDAWEQTAPRGPETVARSLYTTPVYLARHRASLEDSEAYQRRTLRPGWRPPQIPIREVFRA